MEYLKLIRNLLSLKKDTSKDGISRDFFSQQGIHDMSGVESLTKEFKIILPDDFITFLQSFNGLSLYVVDDIGGYKFFTTKTIALITNEVKSTYSEADWDNSIIIFGEIIGEGNYFGLKTVGKNEYSIVDCFHEYLPSQWEVISTTFEFFFENLILNDGEKYWLRL